MAPSTVTKGYKRKKRTYLFLSLLCTIGPVVYFIITAMLMATPVQKNSIVLTTLVAIIITIVNVIINLTQSNNITGRSIKRSAFWLILLGAYWVLGNVFNILVLMFITSFLDEMWFTPRYNNLKLKYTINKEYDKRG